MIPKLFFDSIKMLRFGKTKVAKAQFHGAKNPEKFLMLMVIV